MSLATSQNALSTASEEVAAANRNRTYLEVKNLDAAITVYIGADSTVTSSTGYPVPAGTWVGFSNMPDAVHAIAASGTPTVAILEWSR